MIWRIMFVAGVAAGLSLKILDACGRGNVGRAIQEGKDVDTFTAGHDYSADVLKRAAWFKTNA